MYMYGENSRFSAVFSRFHLSHLVKVILVIKTGNFYKNCYKAEILQCCSLKQGLSPKGPNQKQIKIKQKQSLTNGSLV